MAEGARQETLQYIVRLVSTDLDGKRPIYQALTKIKGISHRLGLIIARVFEEKTGIAFYEKIGRLNEEQVKLLEDIIKNPLKYEIPEWAINRQKEFYTGQSRLAIGGELEFVIREDLKRLNKIKSYRGLRHAWGLTVRGQRTKSTHRGKGPTVGVMKKEAKKAGSKEKAESKSPKK